MARSECMAQTGVSGPARRATSCAPHASAAAVPSGRGSTRMFSSGRSRTAPRMAGAMSRLVTTITRDQRLKAADGVLEQRVAGYQREERLGAFGRREGPKARADSAGEYDGPEREAGDSLTGGRELWFLKRSGGRAAAGAAEAAVRAEVHPA